MKTVTSHNVENHKRKDSHPLRPCVLIPTYNNAGFLGAVLNRVRSITSDILVVNDGSTDNTAELLKGFGGLTILNHATNKGKGAALSTGFQHAASMGFTHAIALDSDGQHFPEDIPVFLEALKDHPRSIIVGARELTDAGQPARNAFANRLSNFWYYVETGQKLPDTQSGFRLYPLAPVNRLKISTKHYDYELEVLVKAHWQGIPIETLPVRVFYPPDSERVSHFRPLLDFWRITLLNIRLVILSLFWYRPILALKSLSPANIRRSLKKAFNKPGESIQKKCHAAALGVFFGIVPIWGYQLISAIVAAYALRLNKAIVALTAQISIPPMIPLIIYLSIRTGEWALGTHSVYKWKDMDLDIVKQNVTVYVVGACIFAVIAAGVTWVFCYFLLRRFQKYKPSV